MQLTEEKEKAQLLSVLLGDSKKFPRVHSLGHSLVGVTVHAMLTIDDQGGYHWSRCHPPPLGQILQIFGETSEIHVIHYPER